MTEHGSQDHGKGTENLADREHQEQNLTEQLDREKNPLPENISEYVLKARDELKQYEDQKKFFEKRRKKEIVLELVGLLEKHGYPREWLRLIIAQELGDYISTSYIEKILAEKYPDQKKKIKELSTSQTEEIPRNDDRIPIELSITGESVVENSDDLRNATPYNTDHTGTEISTGSKTELDRQVEIVKKLQNKVSDLETKCYHLDQLARERSIWKEKYTQLHEKFDSYRDNIIRGTTEIEFGSEFLPVKIEYSFSTNQFSARIPGEVIDRILGALTRRGDHTR